MGNWTPGPWHVCSEDQASNRWVIAQADGSSIADCSPVGPWTPVVEADANARLIAAAPNMEAALAYAIDNPEFNSAEFDRLARTAIAKATGETK